MHGATGGAICKSTARSHARGHRLQLFGVINKRSGSGAPERRSLERLGNTRAHDAAEGICSSRTPRSFLLNGRRFHISRGLRDREVFIGDSRGPLPLDVRPVASVDGTIDAALDEGRIRTDLHERLSLIRIDVPALRQRREDIPVLATHFLKELCKANGRPIKTLTRPALTLLAAYLGAGTPRIEACSSG
jgi:hypothetical protein